MLTHEELLAAVPHCLAGTDFPQLGHKYEGKVRDVYLQAGQRILITTDRVSAFDRVLGLIPYKGQVLNQLSLWWFEQTADIVPHHVMAAPDPNVVVGREARPLPIEVVVRGYITGVTTTSLWYLYQQGERRPYGLPLPDGLRKNDALPLPMITPTTKAQQGQHDAPITADEIVGQGLLTADLWAEVSGVALALFGRGQAIAREAGLILVDTKYEMGLVDGQLTLIDEIHTPDSSRYWVAETWGGEAEPENYDKEFLRKWYAAQGYRGEGEPPTMPEAFRAQVAARYIGAYERLTGRTFVPAPQPALARIGRALGLVGN